MSQAARLFHICRRLRLDQKVTAQSLQDELEVSRATIFRDIAVLRDQLQAPIEWDSDAESYRLEPSHDVGSRFVVPEMHMTARQVYGLLTVVNVASALDPGVAMDFRADFTPMLKRLMKIHEISGYNLHKKIEVDLPAPEPQARMAMRAIGPALVMDTPVWLFSPELPENDSLLVIPRRLCLKADGWWLDYETKESGQQGSILVAKLVGAQAA